jgi:Helix-turn-helix domain
VNEKQISHGAEDGALTIDQFCARYGIGRTAAYEEINNGRLEARKRGAKTLIARSAARQWFSRLPHLERRPEAVA